MPARFNIFFAWFFMFQTVAMGWVAATGRMLLEVLSVETFEGDIPGRIAGALLLLLLVYLVMHFRGALPPKGKAEGNGFRIGHRVLLLGNVLAASLFVFHFFATGIESYNTHLILNKFTTAFGYLAMGLFAIGFSLVYQSGLAEKS
jgi:hypothetical protein